MSGRRGPTTPPPKTKASDRRNLLGTTLSGRYLLRSIIGEGGMGKVFEAVHLESGRVVAAKVLNSTQAQRGVSVKRFQQEARAAASIGHGNICQVFDMGELRDGSPYMIMERLIGESLADRIAREGGLEAALVVDTVLQVLSGLDAAHRKGILHRDIKPENIFLTTQIHAAGYPVAKIVDFGVSKMMPSYARDAGDEELSLTRTGMVMGTPYYMSPEQARGQRDLDGRVDVYATGVLLYEALSGKRPFAGQNYNALLLNILTGPVKPLGEGRPDLPVGLLHATEKAMRRAREQRYASAAAFHSDLLNVAKDFSRRPRRDIDETRAAQPWAEPARASVSLPSRAASSDARISRSEPPPPPPPSFKPPTSVPQPRPSQPRSIPPRVVPSPLPTPRAPAAAFPREPASSNALPELPLDYADQTERTGAPEDFDDLPTEIQPSPNDRVNDFDVDDEDHATIVRPDRKNLPPGTLRSPGFDGKGRDPKR